MNNKNQLLVVAALAASMLMAAPRISLAVPVSFQEGIGGYAGTDDTMLASWAGAQALSFGGRENWDVGSFSTTSAALSNTLLRYDVTSLATDFPDGFTVNSATLRLTTSDVAFNTAALGTVEARLLDNANAAWVEGISAGGTEASVSTWNRRLMDTSGGHDAGTGAVPWTAGSGAVSSNGAPVLGSATMVNTTDTVIDIDLTGGSLSFINDWASGGTNGGFYLRAQDISAGAGGRQSFYSSETPTATNRPELILDVSALSPPVGGPADFRLWEEDFNDNLDPVAENPLDWSSIHVTTVEDGMAKWDGATPWKLVNSAPHFFNGVTTVDMDWAVHPGLEAGETSDPGVGWFANVGSDAATSGTSGFIGVNVFLGRDGTGQSVNFNQNTGTAISVPVAEGAVSVSTTITILGGSAGALVEYTIVDSSGGTPITGSYTEDNLTGQHGITTPFFTYTNFVNGQGAIDYLKVANTPNGDFDVDLDADGSDFLKWQRDLGTAASLALWESDFGSAVPLVGGAVSAVPEPSTVSLAVLSVLTLLNVGRRKR